MLKSFGRNLLGDLFGDLSDNTLQECFFAFAVPSEEADFSGLNDMRDIIAPLQKQIAVNIDQKGIEPETGRLSFRDGMSSRSPPELVSCTRRTVLIAAMAAHGAGQWSDGEAQNSLSESDVLV